jgi:hypothetical protein
MFAGLPGISCLATIFQSLRDKGCAHLGPLVLSDLGAISIRCWLRQVPGKENQAMVSDNPVRCESYI